MRASHFTILFWGILSILLVSQIWATDLLPEASLDRPYYFQLEAQPVEFIIRNDNILTADNYTSFVEIRDQNQQVVFTTELEGENLPPFTTETVHTLVAWIPEFTGKYQLTVGVDFLFDIDTSNNSMTTDIYAIIDQNDAFDRLIKNLPAINPCDPNEMVIFMPPEPLSPGDTITNDPNVGAFSVSLTLDNYRWFAYADYDPSAKYSHPGAMITIDGVDGSIAEAHIGTAPVINDDVYMSDPWIRYTTDDLVYGSLPPEETTESFSTIREESVPAGTPSKTCAILVSGKIGEGWERSAFDFDLDLMEGNLTREKLGLQLNADNVVRIGNATAGEIRDAINQAKTGYDKIVFYYTGHGNKGWMVTNDPVAQQLGYLELAQLLYGTDADDICVVIDACYAGTAEGSFRIPREFTQKDVTLVLASMSTKTSLARVLHETSSGEKIWAGFFTWHFAQCYGDPEAESDGQPGISFAEAYNWVRAVNPAIGDSTINNRQNPVLVQSQPQNHR